MVYRHVLSRASLKLKLTPIIFVIRQYFLQEILKQIWITHHLLYGSKDLGPWSQTDKASFRSKWIQGQNQNMEVTKLPLLTLLNFPSTDRFYDLMCCYIKLISFKFRETNFAKFCWIYFRGWLNFNNGWTYSRSC